MNGNTLNKDLGNQKFFLENWTKMVIISGSIQKSFFNNMPQYTGMIFISIQEKRSDGNGFSRDGKLSAKLGTGEAIRFYEDVKNLIYNNGSGFLKSFEGKTSSFSFEASKAKDNFTIMITRNNSSQYVMLKKNELMDLAGYAYAKALAVENMATSLQAKTKD